MFGIDQAKLMNNMRKMQSKTDKLKKEVFYSDEKGDLKIVVRGDNQIESIIIDGEERKDVKNFVNDSMKSVEKKVEKKMKSMAGEFTELMGLS